MNAPLETITVPLGEAQLTVPVPTLVRTFLQQYAKAECTIDARLDALKETRPRIGTRGLYGIYAGVARGVDGEDDAIIEVLEAKPIAEEMTWHDALTWAKSAGGKLPTRAEAALLYANVPELFERAYYWTSERYEPGSDYAWIQSFITGYQSSFHTSDQFRARAVRRLPLQ